MGVLEANTTLIYGVHIRESATDGSDFSNAAADYRVLFLGEDGLLHLKDSAGAVTNIGAASADPAWTTFTPTWTAASVNPAIGNGTLTGAYLISGKTYRFHIHMIAGTTTTFGTGRWDFALGGGVSSVSNVQIAAAYLLDSSAGQAYPSTAWITTGASPLVRPVYSTGAINGINSTVPFTWATTDAVHINGVIEIA